MTDMTSLDPCRYLILVMEENRTLTGSELLSIFREFPCDKDYQALGYFNLNDKHKLFAAKIRYGFADVPRVIDNVRKKFNFPVAFIYTPTPDKFAIGLKQGDFGLGVLAYSHVRSYPELNS